MENNDHPKPFPPEVDNIEEEEPEEAEDDIELSAYGRELWQTIATLDKLANKQERRQRLADFVQETLALNGAVAADQLHLIALPHQPLHWQSKNIIRNIVISWERTTNRSISPSDQIEHSSDRSISPVERLSGDEDNSSDLLSYRI